MIELVVLQMEQAITDLFSSLDMFVMANVLALLAVGALWGRSFALGSTAAFVMFAYLALNIDTTLYMSILYVALTLAAVGMGFKLVRMEGLGT